MTLAPKQEMERELESLDGLWEQGLGDAYRHYLEVARPAVERHPEKVALAAGLVETALVLQRLGRQAAPPLDLLRGDLALARASRLLADIRDRRLQVAFARAIEDQAAAAAAGAEGAPSHRQRLSQAIATA